MTRDTILNFRVNEEEEEYFNMLCEKHDLNKSEMFRVLLHDSKFLYSEDVEFKDINIPVDKLINEEHADTSLKESVERVIE